ncbi:MAG TPA: D-2-hydroxyacid dehydrogenase [Streptosporangiales bacterium]
MPDSPRTRPELVIATPLEDELVARIAAEVEGYRCRHEPGLLPPPRYPGDHRGRSDFRRTPADERRWRELVDGADVLFGIPGDDPAELRRVVDGSSRLRFVQATAAGAGQQVEAAGLTAEELDRVAVASSSGVHAGPLAEFALFGMLAFARGLPRLETDRRERRWDHYAVRDLAGRTAVVLGVGAIGSRIAELAAAFGMYVIGVNASGRPPSTPVHELARADRLPELAPRADVLAITLPQTPKTIGMVDAGVLAAMPPGAIVVNVGRGRVVDEATLVDLLDRGHLAGAALDVTAEEPPAPDSPLWTLPNVILSPHTAALSPHENERIVDLFVDNVRRLDTGRPVRNRITAARSY